MFLVYPHLLQRRPGLKKISGKESYIFSTEKNMSAQNFYFAPKFSLNAGFSVPSSAFSDKKIPTRRFSDNNFKGGGKGRSNFFPVSSHDATAL